MKPLHEKDAEYFNEFPSPIMQMLQEHHFTHLNATITFFGPMLYFLARAIEAHQVLEIGHAEGYTAWYLANAVRDNGVRYNVKNGMYYGIDIVQTDRVKECFAKHPELPVTILNMDSMTLKADTFGDTKFDIIFQDGCHDREHVLYELETMYPALRDQGFGYFIMHDVYGPAEETFNELIPLLQTKYNFEWCRLWASSYGLAILRKMDGYDPAKRYWTP